MKKRPDLMPIRNPYIEMICFVHILYAFLQILYLNSVCFLKNQFFNFFFKKITYTEFLKNIIIIWNNSMECIWNLKHSKYIE